MGPSCSQGMKVGSGGTPNVGAHVRKGLQDTTGTSRGDQYVLVFVSRKRLECHGGRRRAKSIGGSATGAALCKGEHALHTFPRKGYVF